MMAEKKHSSNQILAVLVVGVLMAAIDIAIVILALPTIDTDLGTSPIVSIWTIMAYILVITVISSQLGKIGDKYGRERIYNYGLVVFVIGSVLCGLSPTIYFLIGFRALQALGGGMISSNSSAVISDNFEPHERGKAFGFTAIGWSLGSILGIILGGILATINWRLIFLINLPIGLVIIPLSFSRLRNKAVQSSQPLDIIGSVLLGIALTILTVASISTISDGFSSTVLTAIAISLVMFAVFAAWELRHKFPVIDFSIFKSRVFAFSSVAGMLVSTASFAVLFLLILYLQGVRGLSPLTSSLYLLPGYIIGMFIGPLSGRLSDKIGARVPATIGLVLTIAAYLAYATLLGVSSPIYLVSLITILTGAGSGFFYPANMSAIMANAPRDKYGMASGVTRTMNNIGMVLSFAVALAAISTAIPRATAIQIFAGTTLSVSAAAGAMFMHGLQSAFYVSSVIIALSIILSIARGREDRAKDGARNYAQPGNSSLDSG